MTAGLLVLLLACAGGGGELGDCGVLTQDAAREQCRLEALQALSVDQAGDAIDALPDAASRDLLRVQLVVADPLRFGPLCQQVQHQASAAWCRDVLDRVHLHEPVPGTKERP